MAVYEWQDRLYNEWSKRGFIGCVRAPTGSGKSLAGVIALGRYLKDHPDESALILSPSSKVSESWEGELDAHGVQATVMTYQTAVNRMTREGLSCDVMIADECHRLCTPVQGRVLDMGPKAILGLSATPEGSVEILGQPFLTVSFSDANLCPFTVHFVSFTPTKAERDSYDRAAERMRARARYVTDGQQDHLPPGRDSVGWSSYDALARKRREVCYLMPSRLGHVMTLIRRNLGRRTVVYFERVKSVEETSKMLDKEGIPHAVHLQGSVKGAPSLKAFEDHETDLLIACKSLREGWNDPSIECIILGSINIGTIINTQTIGRALRVDPGNPDKHADIYLLMADGTGDVNVTRRLDLPRENTVSERIEQGVLRW